jgi:hypothetical protein
MVPVCSNWRIIMNELEKAFETIKKLESGDGVLIAENLFVFNDKALLKSVDGEWAIIDKEGKLLWRENA